MSQHLNTKRAFGDRGCKSAARSAALRLERAPSERVHNSRVKSAQIVVRSWNISSNTALTSRLTIWRSVTRKHFQLCVWRRHPPSLRLPLPPQLKVPLLQMNVGVPEVCVEKFYLRCISVTVGYHVSPHPLQSDPDLRAQMQITDLLSAN